jgi:hypothetical protein
MVVVVDGAVEGNTAAVVVVVVARGTGGLPLREEVAVVSPPVIKSMLGT